jgi:hypothetical protein
VTVYNCQSTLRFGLAQNVGSTEDARPDFTLERDFITAHFGPIVSFFDGEDKHKKHLLMQYNPMEERDQPSEKTTAFTTSLDRSQLGALSEHNPNDRG